MVLRDDRGGRLARDARAAVLVFVEARAQEAQQGHAYEEARQEEQLRRADELDPDVDTSARDYSPTTPGAQDTTTTDRPADTGNDSRYDDTDDRHRS